jgi:hypothetical protein
MWARGLPQQEKIKKKKKKKYFIQVLCGLA